MTTAQSLDAGAAVTTGTVDTKLEVVVIPVADVDRAKAFYAGLGWRLDADFPFDNGFRVVQLTPPGSDCSLQFGSRMTTAAPGSAQGNYLIVSDIQAARDQLAANGADVSEVFHPGSPGAQFQPESAGGRLGGPSADSLVSEEAKPLLQMARKDNPDFKVIIRGEKEMSYRFLEPVLITCMEANVKNVAFNTSKTVEAQ